MNALLADFSTVIDQHLRNGYTYSLSLAMGAWSSSATVNPASAISSRTLINMSAQRSVKRKDARRFI